MATTSSSGRNRTISGRSLVSQKISPSGRIVSGCDFGEKKDTTHLGRALSFDRRPSVRSFHIGDISPPTEAHIKHARKTKTKLRRSNAVRFGPIEYLRYIYHNFRMRMRLRRRSPVTFTKGKSTRKRSYALVPQSSTYQYRVRRRDIVKRTPSLRYRGISSPFNPLHGSKALEVAERGKNQIFNIRTAPHVQQKTLPTRESLPPDQLLNRASLVFPNPPDVGGPGQAEDDSDVEYDDLPSLVPPISARRARESRSQMPTNASQSHSETLQNSNSGGSFRTPRRMYEDESPVDIEDALDFVSAWGSYLQQMVASRVIKERELRQKEHSISYEESDASSLSGDEEGIFDSCTSDCFAPSDWVSEDEPWGEHQQVQQAPLQESPQRAAPQAQVPQQQVPQQHIQIPVGFALAPTMLLSREPQTLNQRARPPQRAAPPVPAHDAVQQHKLSPVRKPSGPRPMRTRHMSLGEQVPPLQLSRQATLAENSPEPREPQALQVRRSLMRLQSSRARPLSTTFDFDTDSLSSQTNWVRKTRTPSSGSPLQSPARTPGHSPNGSVDSQESQVPLANVSAWSSHSVMSVD